MSNKYLGDSNLSRIVYPPETTITIKINSNEVNFLQNIIDCYENLAVVIPVNPKEGLIKIITTPNLIKDVHEIIENMPLQIKIL